MSWPFLNFVNISPQLWSRRTKYISGNCTQNLFIKPHQLFRYSLFNFHRAAFSNFAEMSFFSCSQKEFHLILYEVQVSKKLQKLQTMISRSRSEFNRDEAERDVRIARNIKSMATQRDELKRRLAKADEWVLIIDLFTWVCLWFRSTAGRMTVWSHCSLKSKI